MVEDEFLDIDREKILRMCLIHDFGEAVCGDVPSFEKTDEDEQAEAQAVDAMLSLLSEKKHREFSALFAEMNALETREAKIWRALDMLEAAAQHNEEPYLSRLRALVRRESEEKLRAE